MLAGCLGTYLKHDSCIHKIVIINISVYNLCDAGIYLHFSDIAGMLGVTGRIQCTLTSKRDPAGLASNYATVQGAS